MMFKVAKLGIAFAAVLAMIVPAAYAGVPDLANSFYVPQAGNTTTPVEGTHATTGAVRFFRMCPNNDGGSSVPSSARIKVVVRDVNNNPIPNIAAADICILFNGGTPAQGFVGSGADSVIANSQFNSNPLCPDVRCVAADAPTNALGEAIITFAGADAAAPGVAVRNSNRKWGHYDTTLPVFVLGFQLSGRANSAAANGSYVLRIKNYDHIGGLTTSANVGEAVTSSDFNPIAAGTSPTNPFAYWRDFDTNGAVGSSDFNAINAHTPHDCRTPNNP